jgi:peroxiredoxin
MCVSELRSIQASLPALRERGITPVAISADSPEDERRMCEKAGIDFPVLSDHETQVGTSYDLVLPKYGPEDRAVDGPGEFLIDTSGTIRWRKLEEGHGPQFVQAAAILR